jgi:small subunit ribosomal protein S4
MGDPSKSRKKYSGPSHPWQKQRIDDDNAMMLEFGLVNKKEIWRLSSLLRRYKKIAKKPVGATGQAQKEKDDLLKTLTSYGLLKEANLDEVLSLSPKHLFERRLQTVVFRKNMAHTLKQARQFITHGHITIGSRKVTVPGYLVTIGEEGTIGFLVNSSLASPDHPERQMPAKEVTVRAEDGKETKE